MVAFILWPKGAVISLNDFIATVQGKSFDGGAGRHKGAHKLYGHKATVTHGHQSAFLQALRKDEIATKAQRVLVKILLCIPLFTGGNQNARCAPQVINGYAARLAEWMPNRNLNVAIALL